MSSSYDRHGVSARPWRPAGPGPRTRSERPPGSDRQADLDVDPGRTPLVIDASGLPPGRCRLGRDRSSRASYDDPMKADRPARSIRPRSETTRSSGTCRVTISYAHRAFLLSRCVVRSVDCDGRRRDRQIDDRPIVRRPAYLPPGPRRTARGRVRPPRSPVPADPADQRGVGGAQLLIGADMHGACDRRSAATVASRSGRTARTSPATGTQTSASTSFGPNEW